MKHETSWEPAGRAECGIVELVPAAKVFGSGDIIQDGMW